MPVHRHPAHRRGLRKPLWGEGGSSSNFCILDFLSILSPTPLFFNVASVPTWHNSGQSVEAVLSVCHGSDSEFPDRSHV